MTYAEAWKLTQDTNYETACREGWRDEWEAADEHISIADYDCSTGLITAVTEYDEEAPGEIK